MSSIITSNNIEKTLSQTQTQLLVKTFRGVEDEIAAKINNFRLKISNVKQKLEELIKESSNPQDHTITIKELDKVVKYESQENLDKLMNYLSHLSEKRHTIPDFFYTPFLNSVFTRNFGSVIDSQKGLFQKNQEVNEKLKKLIPSKNYLGLYIPNINLKNIEALLCFVVLEEFLMLSDKAVRLKSDNLVIEVNSDEIPPHISLLNPSFNTLAVYAGEKEQHLYLLFLTDVLELLGPDNNDPYVSKELLETAKKSKHRKEIIKHDDQGADLQDQQLQHLKQSLPEYTLEQVKQFIDLIDDDDDYKITAKNVLDLVRKHKLVWEDSLVNNMFEEIFQRRTVVVEQQRRKPVDAYEVYHANHQTQSWTHTTREFKEQWIMLFKLLGIEMPKYTLPALQPSPLRCSYDEDYSNRKPKINKKNKNTIYVIDPKPDLLKKQYTPEGNVLIQNTQHISEVYIEDKEQTKTIDSNKNAFQTLVNAKFKDVTQKTDFKTVTFDTQAYYSEALRLSKDPDLYANQEVNPIFKYMPIKKDYVYQQSPQEFESLRDNGSFRPNDEVDEYDDSIDPTIGSKRATTYTFKEPQLKSMKSNKSSKESPNVKNPRIFGCVGRSTTLSSSMKPRTQSPQSVKTQRPMFLASFKTPDNNTIKAHIAKMEPILDPYTPPKTHLFRDDFPPEKKPPFAYSVKEGIPDVNKQESWPMDALEQEMYEREMYQKLYKGSTNDQPWVRYFRLAPRERSFVDGKYPDFLAKGQYVDGYMKVASFIKGDFEADIPFKLFHRSLKRTDKNLFFGDTLPSKM